MGEGFNYYDCCSKILHYLASKLHCLQNRSFTKGVLHFLYCIVFVLLGWSLLPNALRPFKIYCAPPNLGITRTWICRLNFAQRPIFSDMRFLTRLKSQTRDPQLKKSLLEDLCSGFLRSEKIHRPQPDLNPQTLDLEASTLPRVHRGRLQV